MPSASTTVAVWPRPSHMPLTSHPTRHPDPAGSLSKSSSTLRGGSDISDVHEGRHGGAAGNARPSAGGPAVLDLLPRCEQAGNPLGAQVLVTRDREDGQR